MAKEGDTLKDVLDGVITTLKGELLKELETTAKEDEGKLMSLLDKRKKTEEENAKLPNDKKKPLPKMNYQWVAYFKRLSELQQKINGNKACRKAMQACRTAMPWIEHPYNQPLWDSKATNKEVAEWCRDALLCVLDPTSNSATLAAIETPEGKEKEDWVMTEKRQLSLPLPLAALCPVISHRHDEWQRSWSHLDRATGWFLKDAVTLTERYKETPFAIEGENRNIASAWGAFLEWLQKGSFAYAETMMDWRVVADFLDDLANQSGEKFLAYAKAPLTEAEVAEIESREKSLAYAKVTRLPPTFNKLNIIRLLMDARDALERGKTLYLKGKPLYDEDAEKLDDHLKPLTSCHPKSAVTFGRLAVGECVESGKEPNRLTLWNHYGFFPRTNIECSRPFRRALDYFRDNREKAIDHRLKEKPAENLVKFIERIINPNDADPILIPGLGFHLRRCDLSSTASTESEDGASSTESTKPRDDAPPTESTKPGDDAPPKESTKPGDDAPLKEEYKFEHNDGTGVKNHGKPWDDFLDDLFTRMMKKNKNDISKADIRERRKRFFERLLGLAKEEAKEPCCTREVVLHEGLKNLLYVMASAYLDYRRDCGVPICSDYTPEEKQRVADAKSWNTVKEASAKAGKDLCGSELIESARDILSKHISNKVNLSDNRISNILVVVRVCKQLADDQSSKLKLKQSADDQPLELKLWVGCISKAYGIKLEASKVSACLDALMKLDLSKLELPNLELQKLLGLPSGENEVQ